MVKYAIQNPSKVSDNREWAHKDVLNALPPLLKGISINLDYVPRCCDLLWHLGRDNEIPTVSYHGQAHAISVLFGLAGYDIYKSLYVNSAVLDAIERWLKEPDAHGHIHSPLDVLDPLLAKEGDSLQGHSVVSTPFSVPFEKTKSIRKKAISLLSKCIESQSTKVVLRASKSLIDALNPPCGRFGRVVSDTEVNRWLPEQMRILEIIENLVKDAKDPIVHIQVASYLKRHAKHGSQKVIADKADSIIKSSPNSFDLRITRAIWGQYGWDGGGENYNQHRERANEEIKQIVTQFLDRFDGGMGAFDFLNERLSHFQSCGIPARPDDFLYILSTTDCRLSIELCKHIISHPSSHLAIYLSSLLSGIQEKSPNKAMALIRLAIETKDKTLCSSVAYGYARRLGSSIEDDGISVIETLLTHPDRTVKCRAIEALGRFPAAKRDKAIQILLNINIEDDEKLADAFCEIFNSVYGIPPDELDDEDLKTILLKLTRIRKLDDHLDGIDEFLGYCSSRIPGAVVDLLLERLDIAEEKEKIVGDEYQPLPYLGFHHGLRDISSSSNYKDIIRKVRDRALDPIAIDYFWLTKLFAEISDGFSSACLEVLDEWIESGDVKKIQAVGSLLKDASPEFIFSHSEFVSRLVEKSCEAGEDCHCVVTSDLCSSATNEVRLCMPGQPASQDATLRDQAKELSQKFPMGSPTQRFYSLLWKHAESSIRDSLARDEERFVE